MWVDQPCLRLLLERPGSYWSKQTRMPAWVNFLFFRINSVSSWSQMNGSMLILFSLCKYGGGRYWDIEIYELVCVPAPFSPLSPSPLPSSFSLNSSFYFLQAPSLFNSTPLFSSGSILVSWLYLFSQLFFSFSLIFSDIILYQISSQYQIHDLSYIHLHNPLPLQNKIAIFLSCLLVSSSFFYFWHVACADVYQRACRLFGGQCGKTKFYNMRTFLETMCPLTCGQCRISSFAGTQWNLNSTYYTFKLNTSGTLLIPEI